MGLLNFDLTPEQNNNLINFGIGMMAAGAPSRRRVGMGEALLSGMANMNEANYMQQRQQMERERFEFDKRYREAQLRSMEAEAMNAERQQAMQQRFMEQASSMMGGREVPAELPQLSAKQGQPGYRLNTDTPEQRATLQKQLDYLAKNDPQSHQEVLAALVKQGDIAPPTRVTQPDLSGLARLSAYGQLSGIKGAGGMMEYAKFAKPDWQQVDTGGQIQWVNRNSGTLPAFTKTDTPELGWNKYKFGQEQETERTRGNLSRETELRKEFAGLQTSQDWWNVQPVLQSAREAAKVDDKAADLNLIYSVAKLYDPGSVVRESETDMQIKSGSPAEQFQGLWNQVIGGGRLTPEIRQKIMRQVETRARGYEDAYNARAGQYRTIAERYSIDPRNVITEGSVKAQREEPKAATSQYSASVGGKTYYFPDQQSLNNFKLKAGVR